MFQGLINGKDNVFLLKKENGAFYSYELNCNIDVEAQLTFPTLKGSADLKRYKIPNPDLHLLYPYKIEIDENGSEDVVLIDEYEMAENYPNSFIYLLANDELLRSRSGLATATTREREIQANPEIYPIDENGKRVWFYSKDDFYKYSRTQALNCVTKPKLLVPSLFKEPAFFWDESGQYAITGSGSGGGGAYAMYLREEYKSKALQLTGIMNSSVLLEWFERRGDLFSGYYIGVDEKTILAVPLPDLDSEEIQAELQAIEGLVLQIWNITDNALFKEVSNSIDSIVRRLYKL